MVKKASFLITSIIFLSNFVMAQDSTQIAQWEDFKSRYGTNLKIKWNHLTNTPGVISGQLIDLGYTGIKDSAAAENLALNFIKNNKDFLRVDPDKLELWKNYKLINYRFVVFKQRYKGILVQESKVGFAFTTEYKIKAIGDHFHPNINVSTTPTINSKLAVDVAAKSLNLNNNFNVEDMNLLVYPKEIEGSLYHYLVWKFKLFSQNPFIYKIFYVDANKGSILVVDNAFRNEIIVDGEVTGRIKLDSGSIDNNAEFYKEYVYIVDGEKRETTSSSGYFEINTGTTNPVTLKFELAGPYSKIEYDSKNPYYYSTTVTPPTTKDHYWETGSSGVFPPANAFYHMNEIRNFFYNKFNYSWGQMPVKIAAGAGHYADGSKVFLEDTSAVIVT
jgi:Zn-dependent metalloprotease